MITTFLLQLFWLVLSCGLLWGTIDLLATFLEWVHQRESTVYISNWAAVQHFFLTILAGVLLCISFLMFCRQFV